MVTQEVGRAPVSPIAILALAQSGLFLTFLGYWSFHTPFPYGDGLDTFLYAVRYSWSDVWTQLFSGTAEFRPLYFSAVKLVHDLAGGPSVAVFRTIQVGFIGLDLALFFLLLRPRDAASWFGFTLGTSCFLGLHTSTDNLTASTPLPFGPVVFALILGTLLLLRRKPSPALDGAAAAMSLVGVFLIEYGVAVGLMWIVAGVARLGAARRRTAVAAAAALGVYAALRLLTNAQAVPGPFYTETAFLFRELSLPEQVQLFGERVWLFSLYNVTATAFSVFLSEPRAGLYHGLNVLLNDASVRPWQILHWSSSLLATTLLCIWAARWKRLDEESLRTLVLGVVVILSNSALGYMYTRDRIPTAAGMYYATLVGLAGTYAWARRPTLSVTVQRRMLTVLLVAVSAAWVWRAVGTVVTARDHAWIARNEWTEANQRERGLSPDELTDALRHDLQERALGMTLPDPRTDPAWTSALFERFR